MPKDTTTEEQMCGLRGGDGIEIARCYVTGRALAEHDRRFGTVPLGDIKRSFIGRVCTRQNDKSPYFILEENGVRYVFCLKRGSLATERAVVLVEIQKSYKRD